MKGGPRGRQCVGAVSCVESGQHWQPVEVDCAPSERADLEWRSLGASLSRESRVASQAWQPSATGRPPRASARRQRGGAALESVDRASVECASVECASGSGPEAKAEAEAEAELGGRPSGPVWGERELS